MIDSPPSAEHSENPAAQLLERLALGDRNVALAMGVLLEIANAEGSAAFGLLVTQFREAVLAVLVREGRDHDAEAAKLSLEAVGQYLRTMLVPRMVEAEIIVLPPHGIRDPKDRISVAPDVWASIAPHVQDSVKHLRSTGEHRSQQRTAMATDMANMPANPSVLSAEGLVKVYRGRRVVNDVALRVSQGEIVGLLGPNGAGKTTTFYMLVGLISPQAGKITLENKDITSMPMYKRARAGIGYLSQEPSVFRKLTVEQNIRAILETLPLSGQERKARLETLLDELGIKHLRSSYAYQLSGGERRRLEITRALVTEPKFMMLDEPFAGVDPIAVHDIQSIVANLRYRGIGVLISDHNVEQTLDIVDRAYIMFEGQVKVSGTVRELVFDDTVAHDYLGPTLTARLRSRFSAVDQGVTAS
jgi:lipopolysaccharide export system ATP-binding protein